MVKDQITITIEREIRKKIDDLVQEFSVYGSNRSAVIETLLKEALREKRDISIVK